MSPESLLFGGEKCRESSGCASGRCSLGVCVGFMMNSIEAVRLAQYPMLVRAARDPDTRGRMSGMLRQVLWDAESDPFLRARAAQALLALPAPEVVSVLEEGLGDPDEPVRFQAARSLHRLGDPRGTEALRAFLEHPSAPVRALARHALDHESAVTVSR